MIKKISISLFALTAAMQSLPSYADSCNAGYLLFRDTLYGAAVGAGVGALILVANQNSNNIAPVLATSTLVGGGVGLGIGILEITLDGDCSFQRNKSHYNESSTSLKASPIVSFVQNDQRNVTLQPSKGPTLDMHTLEMGVGLTYSF